jgi:phytoene dehydrogenase-like protein
LRTDKAEYRARFVISGVPLNNTLALFEGLPTNKYTHQVLDSESLNSAFQMGIGFKNSTTTPATIHHQIHLPKALTGIGAASIFLSINHPDDHSRCDEAGHSVASVSTHLPDPGNKGAIDKSAAEAQVLDILEQRGFLKREHIVYMHSSTQKSWEKWTGRAFGFVGGYPQWMRIKPWQMVEARLDGHGAYLCGDTTYPGQGIPGTVLSGIIAAEKLLRDWPEARSERFATVRQTDVLITE